MSSSALIIMWCEQDVYAMFCDCCRFLFFFIKIKKLKHSLAARKFLFRFGSYWRGHQHLLKRNCQQLMTSLKSMMTQEPCFTSKLSSVHLESRLQIATHGIWIVGIRNVSEKTFCTTWWIRKKPFLTARVKLQHATGELEEDLSAATALWVLKRKSLVLHSMTSSLSVTSMDGAQRGGSITRKRWWDQKGTSTRLLEGWFTWQIQVTELLTVCSELGKTLTLPRATSMVTKAHFVERAAGPGFLGKPSWKSETGFDFMAWWLWCLGPWIMCAKRNAFVSVRKHEEENT